MMIGSTDKTPMINWKRGRRKLKQWRRDEGGKEGGRGGERGREGGEEGRRGGVREERREGVEGSGGRRERGGAQPTLTVDEPVVKILKHCIIA